MASDSGETKKTKPRAVSASKKKIIKKNGKKLPRPFEEVDRHVHDVLLELMSASASDSVRVAAAKALMDHIKKGGEEDDETRRHEDEHAAAIVEAQRLLDELAFAKSGGVDCAGQVDQDGPSRPTDT